MRYNLLSIETQWLNKIRALKKLDLLPKRWTNAKLLAGFLKRIDIMLLYSTPAKVHKTLGLHLKCVDPTAKKPKWVETKKDVLPLTTAQRFMLDMSWSTICADMTAEFKNEKDAIGSASMLALRDLIEERDLGAVKIGLAFSGKYIPTVKHKGDKSEKDRGKRLNEYAKKAREYNSADVEDIKDNH